jgi:hypothetical protein
MVPIDWRLAVPVLALVSAGAGCASILGVDKDYVLDRSDSALPGADARTSAGIRCGDGGTYCAARSQECCQGTDIVCDDETDCAGQLCCINFDQSRSLLGTQCASSCPSGGPNGHWLELCDPRAAACTTGTCTPLSVQPSPPLSETWFNACQ